MEISAYSTGKVNSSAENKLNIQKEKESLDMQDFLNLLVAQITNQDAMNPMDNTEFISQMAQFSSLQAMSDLRDVSMQGQATSLIGKNVIVADYNNKGILVIDEGVVQRVTIYSGQTKLYVNDKEYNYSNIMEIKEAKKEEDPVLKALGDILKGVNNVNDNYIKYNAPLIEEEPQQ